VSAGWVAGSVRGRLLLGRRLGQDGARSLASAPSLEAALSQLAGTAYARAATPGAGLEEAERAVAASTLFALRVLAGWLPRGAIEVVRSLAAWFELANIEDRLAYLLGGDLLPPYELGALTAAWPRVALAQTPAELRLALGSSVWGDPGREDVGQIHLALRLAWARRVVAVAPEAGPWAAAAVALLRARAAAAGLLVGPVRLPGRDPLPPLERRLVSAPRAAAEQLWRAELDWWRSVAADAEWLARGAREGRGVIVGTVALLGLDAVRVRAALGVAARGGTPAAREALDALL
jgi:hypothetical protein